MPHSPRSRVEISGEVVHLRLIVQSEENDEKLFSFALEREQELARLVGYEVKATLGPEFEVLSFRVGLGSVQIFIVLGTLYTVYMGFSRYESFVKSLNLLISQISSLLRRYFTSRLGLPDGRVSVAGTWQPGPGMNAAEQILRLSSGPDARLFLLLGYLILSHAALLAVLIWIVLKHIR